ncbi:MAG TPA: hypothetical protein ENH33_00570 [Actinobacteria bacterium]|nr:hypothetical protein [Actinomycetota bacterium]
MGRITDPNGAVTASLPKSVQAAAPHAGRVDSDLSARTIRLWYEMQRRDFQWPYASPDDAPYVEVTASFTEYDFQLATVAGNDPLLLPWVTTGDTDAIRVSVVLARDDTNLNGLLLKAYSATLIDAVSTVEGPLIAVPASNFLPPPGPWRTPDNQFAFARVELIVRDPDLAASGGLIGIGVKAEWQPAYEPADGGAGLEDAPPYIRLASVNAWNKILHITAGPT